MVNVQDEQRTHTPGGMSHPHGQETAHTGGAHATTPGIGVQLRDAAQQVRDTAQEMGAQVRDTAQQVGTQLRDKAQEIGTQAQETIQQVGTQLRDRAQEIGAQAQETMAEYYEQGRESLRDLNQTLEAQIRDKPLQALLVAGGIGLLLGLLWRRS